MTKEINNNLKRQALVNIISNNLSPSRVSGTAAKIRHEPI